MTKYLNKEGLTKVWGKVKAQDTALKTALEAEIAKKQDTLVSGTSIKTVNGTSLLGSGDITIDLTLYKVVTSLPTSGIDENKIYLVLSGTSGTQNKYTEYVYVNSAWEKLGEYAASVDLTPYAKKTEAVKSISISGKTVTITMADGTTSTQTTQDTTYNVATTSANGLMSSTDKTKLDGIAAGANKTVVDSALSSTSENPVQNKAVNTALGNKVDKVSGKGLSTNDYTTAEKTKLAGIAEGANKYVLPVATSDTLGGVKIDDTPLEGNIIISGDGVIDTIQKFEIAYTEDKPYGVTLNDGTYSLTIDRTAASSEDGLTSSGTIGLADTTYNGFMSSAQVSKLSGIATGATADEALSDSEIDAICV